MLNFLKECPPQYFLGVVLLILIAVYLATGGQFFEGLIRDTLIAIITAVTVRGAARQQTAITAAKIENSDVSLNPPENENV